MKKSLITFSVVALIGLGGCAGSSSSLGSDVYSPSELNTAQNAKNIQITSVSPAKIRVDNTENKRTAQTIGGVVGAVGGAILGNKMGGGNHETGGTVAGGVLGGAAGVGLGSMVDDEKIIEGVTLTYKENGKLKSSTQAGRMCQFAPGSALLISGYEGETRIQPNAVCAE